MSDVAVPAATPSSNTPAPSTALEAKSTSAVTPEPNTETKAAPPEPKAPATPTAAEKRKYKLKVDGKDQELELDDTEISIRLQKATAAEKRMQEAAEQRKQIQAVLEFIKKDPIAALKDPALGIDVEKMVEERLAQRYQDEMKRQQMTPEQLKMKEIEDQLQAERAKREELEKTRAAEAKKALDEKIWADTQKSFFDAMAEEGVEQNYETIFHMAEIAKMNLEHKIELTPKQMAAEVKARMDGAREKLEKAARSTLKGDKLLSYLGQDTVNEVIQATLAKYKAKPAVAPPPAAEPEPEVEPKRQELISSADFRRRFQFGI